MKTKPYLLLLFLILTVFSCSNRDAAKMLNDIESYMQERPDSALAEIRSIDTTRLNTRELRAKYSLLHAMALDKNYIDTTDIRIIEPALSYYTHHGRGRMLTHFYAGRIHENEQDYADALIFYNDALENASEQDYLYRGLINSYIADIYHYAYSFREELHYKEIALGYFEKLGKRHYIDQGIFGLANAWHNNRDFNKADSLYRKISAQGDSLRPLAVSAAIARADNALKSGEYNPDEILKLYEFALDNSGEMSLEDYYEYAYLLHRVQRYQESENLLNQLSAYPATYTSTWWRYKTEKDKGNYEEAESLLEESIQMQNLIVREKIAQSIFKSQSKFFKHAAHSAQQKKTIQRQRYLVTILFLLLVLSLITFLYLRKKSSMSRENARLLLAMDESEKMLNIMKTDFEKKYADIEEEKAAQKKKMLELQKMYAGLYQKQFYEIGKYYDTSYLDNPDKASQKITKHVATEINSILSELSAQSTKQSKFEARINRDADNIIAKIRADYPRFSEDDIRFICYIVAGFDATTISVLMNITGENARVKKHRIRTRILHDTGDNAPLYLIWLG